MSDGINKLRDLRDSIENVLPYLSFEINHQWDSAYRALYKELCSLDETVVELDSQVRELEAVDDTDSDLEGILNILGTTHRGGFNAYELEELRGYYASYMMHNRNTIA